jgi:hypothetical protein
LSHELPTALFNALDANPLLPADKKKKLHDAAVGNSGFVNNEVQAAFSQHVSLVANDGTPWDSGARALALALAGRSIILSDTGNAVPPEQDSNSILEEVIVTKHRDAWNRIDWQGAEQSHSAISDIFKALSFIFRRRVDRSKAYHHSEVELDIQRQYAESLSYFDNAVRVINKMTEGEPIYSRPRVRNREFYTFFYPIMAEQFLGKPPVSEPALKAEVARMFTATPSLGPWTQTPQHTLSFTPAPPAPHQSVPPPVYVAPTPPAGTVTPHFVPPVPIFAFTPPPQRKQGKSFPPKPAMFSPMPIYTPFVGKPCSPVIVGDDIGIMCPPYSKHCQCSIFAAFPSTQHRTWECPFAYFAKFGSCPGYTASGARIATAWNASNNSLLPATRAEWKTFIATHQLVNAKMAPGEIAF